MRQAQEKVQHLMAKSAAVKRQMKMKASAPKQSGLQNTSSALTLEYDIVNTHDAINPESTPSEQMQSSHRFDLLDGRFFT